MGLNVSQQSPQAAKGFASGAFGPYAFSLAFSITGGFHLVARLIETAKRSIPLNIIAFGVGYRLF